MPIKRPELITGELYHVYNRGVEKRKIFLTEKHHSRFILALRFFNTFSPVTLREFLRTGVPPLQGLLREGEPLVQIGAFILLPNHYHLLVRQLVDNGLSLFMQKLGAGYTAFFNLKSSRVGPLFQGRYRVKLIDSDRYVRHIQAYIALNALDTVMPTWREKGIKNSIKAQRIVKQHQWSSFSSYIEENKFPGIIDPSFINEFFDTKEEFENMVLSWTSGDMNFISQAVAG